MSSVPERTWLAATGQLWKAWIATVLYPSNAVALLVALVDRERAAARVVASVVLFLVSSLVAISVRCRVCDEWVFVWSWTPLQTPGMLFRLTACPNCGARSQRERLW